MTTKERITPHETFELHELLTFKNVCATKSATMAGLVNDQELKNMLHQDFSMTQGQIGELQKLLQTSELATQGNVFGSGIVKQ